VWSGLGSPIPAERWEFAHVVRNIVELNWTEMSGALAELALDGKGGPFVDEGLEFYSWHARQWLAIGLARGGRETPEGLKPFVPWLTEMIDTDHVAVRAFAGDALGACLNTAEIEKPAADLASINQSPFPPERYKGWREAAADTAREGDDNEKYLFGIDIGPYWLAPMGRAFNLSQGATEARAAETLRDVIGWKGGGWRDDARHSRNIFQNDETRHSHGTSPKADNLAAYHGYHAMMLTAGQLLRERPVGWREDAELDDFHDWLSEQLLTRPDGRWLFDRLDPAFIEDGDPTASRSSDWLWMVNADDLRGKLWTSEGNIVLWGHWSSGRDASRESVNIRSALVSAASAPALISALQTAADIARFTLPVAECDEDIEIEGAQLRGWVVDTARPHGVDEHDPWAQGLRYPGASPSAAVVSALGLVRDLDGRCWRTPEGTTLRSESWTTIRGYGREEESVDHWRLTSDRTFVRALLAANPNFDLVLRVSVQRQPTRYEARGEIEDYPWPYVRYFLMKSDGDPTTN
jgi:hypothetical protein